MNKNIEMKISCPICNKDTILTETEINIPNFGNALISSIRCDNCGFKSTDVMSLEQKREPSIWKAVIESEEDLNAKIIRSSTSVVKIPELGIEIMPGMNSEGFFTNIEGLLDRIQQFTGQTIIEKTPELMEKINKAKNAEIKFTVILEDAFGNSGMTGKNTLKQKLTKKEQKELLENIKQRFIQ